MVKSVEVVSIGGADAKALDDLLESAAREHGFACHVSRSNGAERIAGAERVVLVAAGGYGPAMSALGAPNGLVEAVEHAGLVAGRPFLAFGLAAAMLGELGPKNERGLGWLDGSASELSKPVSGPLQFDGEHRLLSGMEGVTTAISCGYTLSCENDAHCLACLGAHPALVGRDNIAGAFFDPASTAGERLLSNFLGWDG